MLAKHFRVRVEHTHVREAYRALRDEHALVPVICARGWHVGYQRGVLATTTTTARNHHKSKADVVSTPAELRWIMTSDSRDLSGGKSWGLTPCRRQAKPARVLIGGIYSGLCLL